ncbi:ATG13 [Sanghuangporus sanghuang]
MSQESTAQQKADQIAHRFFSKFVSVIDSARNVLTEPREDAKVDKWFNIETTDSDLSREHTRLYKSISQLRAPPPPLELLVLLTVPELTDKQVLVQHPPNSSRQRVEPTPAHVLLERWTLAFVMSNSGSPSSSQMSTGEVTLATVYKHIMSVIRSLYTLLHVLPVWRICKRLRRRPGQGARNGQLGLMLRVRARGIDSSADDNFYLGFDEPLSPSAPPLDTATHTFEPVTHPMGVFSVSVTYLKAPHFEIDTVEALLSSRFLSLDAGPEFTPTLARTSQRESISGSPGSLPMRTTLPHSPPGDRTDRDKTGLGLALGTGTTSSIADRFVFPASNPVATGSPTSLPSTSPRSRTVPLPSAGPVQRSISAQAAAGAASAGSIGSSSRHSREEGRESLPSLARVRRESMGRGSDLPSTPAPLLIRRQSTTVSPFKSGTLSSGSPSLYSNSPSLRHASPLAGPSLPAAPAGRTSAAVPPSPTSMRVTGGRGDTGAGPSSPITAYRAGSSPVLPLRPSPPTPSAPSSLGERRYTPSPAAPSPSAEIVTSGTEPLAAPPRRKRYSSSFGYRYGAAGSEGSSGSGDKGKDPERPGSASYLSTNTDDDDISAFVQDIDARKPIGGGFNTRHDRERTLSETGLAGRAIPAGTGLPEQTRQTQTSEAQGLQEPAPVPGHNRTFSEGQQGTVLAGEAATADTEAREEPSPRQTGAPILSHLDERLRALNNAFRTSMDLVARRPSSAGAASDPEPALSSPFPARPTFPIPGAAHLRTPSFSASSSIPTDRPSSAPGQTRSSSGSELAPRRRFTGTPGGSSGGENISVWDNRRLRTDSTGSSASALSDMERARLFYEQGRASRGSGASVGNASLESEEAVGRMSFERPEQQDGGS